MGPVEGATWHLSGGSLCRRKVQQASIMLPSAGSNSGAAATQAVIAPAARAPPAPAKAAAAPAIAVQQQQRGASRDSALLVLISDTALMRYRCLTHEPAAARVRYHQLDSI